MRSEMNSHMKNAAIIGDMLYELVSGRTAFSVDGRSGESKTRLR
jgi:uncharacterized membrane protein YphA (DoxX/SURF4 family)